ncbi:hypothetical protein N2152v2_011051 [Parachlorella kessleri]
MRPLSEHSGTAEENLAAAAQVLELAENELWRFNAWTLAAFVRCAAAFKGSLQPAGLAAWQKALLRTCQQPHREQGAHPHAQQRHQPQAEEQQRTQRQEQVQQRLVDELSSQGVGNVLLSLGTLAASDAQLAATVDRQLAQRLLEHAAELVHEGDGGSAGGLTPQHATNALFGAALLGLQPARGQLRALLAPVEAGVSSLSSKGITQLLLAFKHLKARGLGVQEGQAAEVAPQLHRHHVYYPGDTQLGAVLEQACQQLRRRCLGEQAAAQIMGACADLGYLPSPHILQEVLGVLAGDSSLAPQHVSAALTGCARLGVQPGPEVIAACWRALVSGSGRDGQAVANTAWALAVLEVRWGEPGMRPRYVAAAYIFLVDDLAHATPLELRQWHQAYLHMKLRHGWGVSRPPDLFQRSLLAHQAECQTLSGPETHFERAVAEAVRQLAADYGINREGVKLEYAVLDPDGEGWLRVDVAIPSLKLAVEADGPVHFLRNVRPLQQTGDTLARNRLLRGWGWDVVVVPHTVMDELFEQDSSHEHIVAGLKEYL